MKPLPRITIQDRVLGMMGEPFGCETKRSALQLVCALNLASANAGGKGGKAIRRMFRNRQIAATRELMMARVHAHPLGLPRWD